MQVEMIDRVNRIPVEFSQHRGGAVSWTMEKVTIPEATYRQLRKLPPRDDPLWGKFRGRLEQLVQRALEGEGGAGGVSAAWDMASRDISQQEMRDTGQARGGCLTYYRWQHGGREYEEVSACGAL